MALFKHLNLTVPKHFDFQRICDFNQFSDLEVTIQNSRVSELFHCRVQSEETSAKYKYNFRSLA